MERPADTAIYRLVHRAMVASAERLAAAADRPGHDVDALAQWAAGFTAELRWHQAEEDAIGFPQLVARVPAAITIVERLDADHRELDTLTDALEQGQLSVAGRLRDVLAAHTFDENVNIAPLIERHLTFDEHRAQLLGAASRLPDQLAGWTVPWLLSACGPDEQPAIKAALPERLQSIALESASSYHALECAAFGH
jgi:Hemerythrin HHE cation binding domain